MINSRRSKIEIIGEILELSHDGAGVTEILYRGNLSYSQLQSYLSFLVEKKILVENMVDNGNGGTRRFYTITRVGLELLGDIHRVLAHLS